MPTEGGILPCRSPSSSTLVRVGNEKAFVGKRMRQPAANGEGRVTRLAPPRYTSGNDHEHESPRRSPPSGTGGDQPMSAMTRRVVACAAFAILLAGLPWTAAPVQAADPIKVGFSMALTGGVAPNGKQNLLALEIWRDDVNAKGGLLERPVELVYYDDQSN